MCRIAKVLLVAPDDRQLELRRALSSLEYDIVAAVASADEAAGITADVAVVWEPDTDAINALRQRGLKTVAIGSDDANADMHLDPVDVAHFKTRIWELFEPS
jgi:hypothetical protein